MSTESLPAESPEPHRGRRKWVAHGLSNRRIYGGLAAGCVKLPLPLLHGISRVGNEIALALMKETRGAVERNFRTALGIDEASARRLSRALFHSYGYNAIDTFRIRGGGAALAPRVTTKDTDAAGLAAAMPEGRGCLIVTGHVGNWEMGAISLGSHGIRSAVVGQPELDPEIQRLRLEVRAKLQVETIDIGSSMATAFQVRDAVDRGLAVAMVADRAYAEDHVFVDFFGRKTPFLRSPALLARFCDCVLLPSFFLRNEDGTYRSFFGPPLRADRSRPAEEDAARMLQDVATVVERAIREAPEQWFNFYDYWAAPLGAKG